MPFHIMPPRQSTYETSGSATAWEAAEEAMELHTAAHLGAAEEDVSFNRKGIAV